MDVLSRRGGIRASIRDPRGAAIEPRLAMVPVDEDTGDDYYRLPQSCSPRRGGRKHPAQELPVLHGVHRLREITIEVSEGVYKTCERALVNVALLEISRDVWNALVKRPKAG